MDSDSPLANSKGLSVKGPSKNFSPCSNTSRLTRREAAPAASFTRAESQELVERLLSRLGPPVLSVSKGGPLMGLLARNSVQPGPSLSQSVGEMWPSPIYLLFKEFLKASRL